MADRLKLTALLIVAFASLCTLGLIVYNFVANDWRLDTDPLDLDVLFGQSEPLEQTDERTASETLRFGDSVRAVRIATNSLRVEVRRSSTSDVEVRLTLNGDATDSTRFATSVNVDASGLLTVAAGATAAAGNASGTLYIAIPPHLTIAIASNDGAISVENVDGTFDLVTTTATLDVSGVRGRLYCASESGAIAVDACTADSIAISTTGDIALSLTEGSLRARGSQIIARQHFGSIDAEADAGMSVQLLSTISAARLTSHSGDIQFRVLNGARFAFEVATPAGAITANVPFDTLTAENATEHYLRATMNGGGIPAVITAERGNVEILLFEAGQSRAIETNVETAERRTKVG